MKEERVMPLRNSVHALVWAYRHATGKLRVPEIDALSKYLHSDSICLDVGAHGGSWSRGLARIVPKGHVYSFEALPYYADVLRKTLKLLGQRQVTVLNRAVAERDGSVQMARKDCEGNTLTGKTHVAINGEGSQEMVSVPAVTLDSFWREICEKRVDFVKCDVEGFELFVLRGARKLIEACRPVFYNELNAEWCERYDYTPANIFSFFDEYEYTPFYIDVEKGVVNVDVEKHVNRDVLFVPKERILL